MLSYRFSDFWNSRHVHALREPRTHASMPQQTGWLIKEPLHPHWFSHARRRFFVLADSNLKWFQTEVNRVADTKPRGQLHVAGGKLELTDEMLCIVCAEDDHDYTQHIIDSGALPCLRMLVGHQNKEIQKETCWTLSNIAAGTVDQIQGVLDSANRHEWTAHFIYWEDEGA